MTTYSIKPPDMSRNIALAGKTVSSRGMNVTYDELGYAVSAVNYGHKIFAGTKDSVRAPSIEAALSGGERNTFAGSVYDRQHFSDRELAHAAELKQQVAEGKLREEQANAYLDEIRALYGYSGGRSGNEYVMLDLPARPVGGEPVSVVASARSVQNDAPAQPSLSAPSAQGTPAAETEREMQEAYQEELRLQQQAQTLQSGLKELRAQDRLAKLAEKEQVSDALLEMLAGEDEEQT